MNEQNLIPNSKRSPSEVRKNGRKGGIKSGETRRAKKDLRMALEMLLERDYAQRDKKGNITGTISGTEAVAGKLFEQAMKGNVKAFLALRSTVGQDPVQKVMIAEVEQDVIDEVEKMVNDATRGG